MALTNREDRQSLAFIRGYSAGNYANAYDTTDWHEWSEDKDGIEVTSGEGIPGVGTRCDVANQMFWDGALLGFFSSYELHEIADEALRDQVRYLRALYGEE